MKTEGVEINPQDDIGIIRQKGSQSGSITGLTEFERLIFHVPEIEVIVYIIQDDRVVTGIKDRTLSLDGEGALKLIVAYHFGQVE